MIDDNYSQATAEELAKVKNKVRVVRNMKFGKDRNKGGNQEQDGNHSRPIRQYAADELVGVDLRRITRLSDIESD